MKLQGSKFWRNRFFTFRPHCRRDQFVCPGPADQIHSLVSSVRSARLERQPSRLLRRPR
jgi:hypothetical protein